MQGCTNQVVVSMMELPPGCSGAHDAPFYIKTLQEILDSGLPYDSICFKDASGTSNPNKFYETIKAARKLLGKDATIWAHTHETAGVGITQYKAAIEAGCDGVDLARSPLSSGTCQPDMLSLWHALKGTDYSLDIDVTKIMAANRVLEECLQDYFFPPEAQKVSSEVILSPMPGGALTANTMMMRDTGTLDPLPQGNRGHVRMCGTRRIRHVSHPCIPVLFPAGLCQCDPGALEKNNGRLWKDGAGLLRSDTGCTGSGNRQARRRSDWQTPVFKGDPLDVLEPGIPKAKALLEENGLPVTDENIFIVGALETPGGNKGLDFLKGERPINVRKVATKTDGVALETGRTGVNTGHERGGRLYGDRGRQSIPGHRRSGHRRSENDRACAGRQTGRYGKRQGQIAGHRFRNFCHFG